ncbi:MAG TPA: hypothetical protein VFW48_01210 [Solirubrobacterales bacterium]|nr:hypothetical protein [Solirubrobacterales bacterium]
MPALAKSKIKQRLERGEIFVPGSWSDDFLRAAAYDLRVAPVYLIAPDGTRFWPRDPNGNVKCNAAVRLQPGEVAFVSSEEQLCMPFDLAGNIAQKFTVARNGLLVLSGLLVDPGYGWQRNSNGSWSVKDGGQRLHFQLANVGAEEFTIVPGQTSIAAIQFLTLDGSVIGVGESDAAIRIPDSDDLLNDLFVQGDGQPLAPFAFFPRSTELGEDLSLVQGELAEHRIKLEATKHSISNLVVFGVLGLTITLFTVACAALIEAIANGSTNTAVDGIRNTDIETVVNHDETVILLVVGGVLIVFAIVAAFSIFVDRVLVRRRASAR